MKKESVYHAVANNGKKLFIILANSYIVTNYF